MLNTKSFDMGRISEILTTYNVNIDNTNSAIIINQVNTNSTMDEKSKNIELILVQKFFNEIINQYSRVSADKNNTEISTSDLKYPTVKRGEVYRCDFGNPFGSEQGYERYAIVIQCDKGNLHSPTTIVIACTTELKNLLQVHCKIIFSQENMIDYNEEIVGTKTNTILAEQIRTVDKRRLTEYIGTLKLEFMDNQIRRILENSLELKPRVQIKPVYINKTVIREQPVKEISIIQMKILSYINIDELIKIIESHQDNDNKCSKILNLFGFDLKKNGVQYLLNAIIISLNYEHFNLETLVKLVAENSKGVESNEIKRVMVARVKEAFKIKSSTLDFIRLINSFLKKGVN